MHYLRRLIVGYIAVEATNGGTACAAAGYLETAAAQSRFSKGCIAPLPVVVFEAEG